MTSTLPKRPGDLLLPPPPPTHTMSWWNKEKTLDEERVNRISFYRKEVKETKHKQANWQAHCFYTLLEDPECEVCKFTTTTRVPGWIRWEARGDRARHPLKFGDAFTADHKVLSEENESRLHHRYAVVVQDLDSHWIQCYPTKRKVAQETMKVCKTSCRHADNSLEFIHACEDLC